MAVALLVLAAAAALHAQVLNSQATSAPLEAAEVKGRLAFAASVGTEAITAITQRAIDARTGTGFSPGDGGFGPLGELIRQDVMASMEGAFPLTEGDGIVVSARLESLSMHSASDEVELHSALGVRSLEEVPVWLEADAAAHLTIEGPGGARLEADRTATARSSLPVLLPISLSARVAAELQPGGLAGRFAGQVAQHLVSDVNASTFETWVAPHSASLGVRLAFAAFLGYSGNESFDGYLAHISRERAHIVASDFYPLASPFDEQFPLGVGGNRTSTSSGVPLTIELVAVEPSFTMNVAFADFTGQEAGTGLWRGYRFRAEGAVAVSFAISTPAGNTTVGPLQIPVSFSAQAAVAQLSPGMAVEPARLAALESEARSQGALSAVGAMLSGLGLLPNATSPLAEAARLVILQYAFALHLHGLPPLEDASLFWAAYGPQRSLFAPLRLEVASAEPMEGRRASVTFDGVRAGSFMIVGGFVQLPRAPLGLHQVGIWAPCGETRCTGATEVAVGASETPARVVLAARPESSILRAMAHSPSEGDSSTAAVALRAVADVLNLQVPADLSNSQARQAFAYQALEHAQAALDAGVGSPRTHAAAEEARDFLKILLAIIDAWAELDRDGGAASSAGAAASVVFSPTPNALVKVTRAGVEVISFTLRDTSAVIQAGSRPEIVLKLERLNLALLGLLAALNLVSNAVKVQDELEEGDAAGAAVASAELVLGFSDAVRAVSMGLLKISNTAAFNAAQATFARATVILGAALLIVEFADLYREHDGNFSSMASALVNPTTVAGLLTLPSLVDGAVSVAAGAILLASGQSIAAAGPLGIAAGLFVLAVVIVMNGQFVASKIWGTLTFDERDSFESALGNQTRALSRVVASANSIDAARLERSARSMGALAADLWAASLMGLDSRSASAATSHAAEAAAASSRSDAMAATQRALRHAAIGALMELDDFASDPYASAAGRMTEGYGHIRHFDFNLNFSSSFPYDGELRVMNVTQNPSVKESRGNWTNLLLRLTEENVAQFTFGYALTITNAIPLREAERFLVTCNAAGERVSALIAQWRALAA